MKTVYRGSQRTFHSACTCRAIVPQTPAETFSRTPVSVKASELSPVSVKSSLGRSAAFPKPTQNAFSAYGLPRAVQRELALTAEPISLIRPITQQLSSLLDKAASEPSSQNSRFFVGKQGSGKSFALLQAVSQAAASDWIVLYIPSAIPLMDSSLPYAYSQEQQIFQQNSASASFLKSFLQANEAKLKDISVFDKTLSQLVKDALAMRDNESRGLSMVLDALASQTSKPVLLAVDNAQALYRPTKYLSSDAQPYLLDSTALSLPRALLDIAAGHKTFQRGAVLFAASSSAALQSISLDIGLRLRQPAAYEKRSELYEGLLLQGSMKPLDVSAKMDLEEAAGLAQMLHDAKRMRTELTDAAFLDKYVASNGQIKKLVAALESSMSS